MTYIKNSEQGAKMRLALYGLSHMIIDMCCLYILYAGVIGGSKSGEGATLMVFVLYNCLAFGTQIFFGRRADKTHTHRRYAAVGGVLTVLAVAMVSEGLPSAAYCLSAVMAGVGNALFHVGGGVDTLLSAKGRMMPNGIFVAPGAIGVALGKMAGVNYMLYAERFEDMHMIMLCCAAAAVIMCAAAMHIGPDDGQIYANAANYGHSSSHRGTAFVITAAAAVVVLRALVGTMMPSRIAPKWDSLQGKAALAAVFAVFAALGKALGGAFGDRFGARRASSVSLCASAVLLVGGIWIPPLAFAATLLFNFTMPVTLCVTASRMPNRYGEAFGLTTFGLLIGSMPSFMISLPYEVRLCVTIPLIIISAVLMHMCCGNVPAEHER